MADAPPSTPRTTPAPRVAEVLRTEPLTPHMVRVVLGGPGLAGFEAGAFSDHYVKLQLAPPDAPDGPTRTRTYTVRSWDAARGELTIDFVVHGDAGVAGPWAAAARPGDTVAFRGPGGAYTPDPAAAWHLMVGDASVIPAISASLARVAPGVPVHVLLEVDGAGDEQPLATPGALTVTWLHREPGTGATGDGREPLAEALQDYAFPPGPVHAFVHGEASTVRAVRRHLLVERGVPREALSVSGYWKRTRTEEGWREDKAEWSRLAEADVAA